MKTYLKKNDPVQVISGKEKGKRGNIVDIDREKFLVKVQGVNMIKRHVKPSQTNPQGGIKESEAYLAISKVMFFDATAGKPTRLGKKKKDGKNGAEFIRVSVASGKEV